MVLNLDSDVANADWIKQHSWDLSVSTPEELYVILAQRNMTVADFKKLPVYQANLERVPWLADIEQPKRVLP